MATFASPRGLALPLRPEKGQQVECNAPLSASTVRVDKSVSPAFEGLDAHAAGAREAARREQLRAFQAGLLGRLERLEKAKREEARARAAQLVLAQDVERGRARQLAAHASADLVRALRVAPGARPPGRPAREGRAPEAEAWPEGKLYAQARQTLGAVLDARAGLRARTAAARAEVGVRADEGEGEGSEAEEDEEGEEAAEARFGSVAEGAAGGGAAPESARARARERLGAVASLACPSACSLGGGAPLASASLAGTTAPEASALRAAARASQRHAGGGRSAEALLLFDSARRESLSAERAYVQLVQAQRTAQQQAARAAEKAARRREEAAREEARSAAVRARRARPASARLRAPPHSRACSHHAPPPPRRAGARALGDRGRGGGGQAARGARLARGAAQPAGHAGRALLGGAARVAQGEARGAQAAAAAASALRLRVRARATHPAAAARTNPTPPLAAAPCHLSRAQAAPARRPREPLRAQLRAATQPARLRARALADASGQRRRPPARRAHRAAAAAAAAAQAGGVADRRARAQPGARRRALVARLLRARGRSVGPAPLDPRSGARAVRGGAGRFVRLIPRERPAARRFSRGFRSTPAWHCGDFRAAPRRSAFGVRRWS